MVDRIKDKAILHNPDPNVSEEAEPQPKHWTTKEFVWGIIGISLTIILCVLPLIYREELTSTAWVARYGLLGLVIISFIAASAFSLTAIPVPYWVLTILLPGVFAERYGIWSPVWVALSATMGATLGQFITFIIGYSGSSLSEKLTSRISPELYKTAEKWVKKYGSWTVFFMSVTANPIHLPMTVVIAALRYPPWKFIVYGFFGQLVKSLVLAFAGYYGLTSLIDAVSATGSVVSTLLIIAAGLLVIAGWQLVVWRLETREKNQKYRAAVAHARKMKMPLLVVGGPWGVKPLRRMFKVPAHATGDVCLDIDPRAVQGVPCSVVSSVTNIPFADKTFGAVFSSHVLEHLPTVAAAKQAIQELNRVADSVYIVCPSKQSIGGWIVKGHHLWVRQDGKHTALQQRGKQRSRGKVIVETAFEGD